MMNNVYATRSEVIFAQVMQRAPELITDEETASLGRFLGNVVHFVGPEWKIFMLSAGQNEPEYLTVGIGKNLPGRLGRIIKSSPIAARLAIYTMVPEFKMALVLRAEIKEYLDQLFVHSKNGWYHVPGGNIVVATKVISDVSADHDWATSLFRYDPKVKMAALSDFKKKLITLRDEVEETVGGVM